MHRGGEMIGIRVLGLFLQLLYLACFLCPWGLQSIRVPGEFTHNLFCLLLFLFFSVLLLDRKRLAIRGTWSIISGSLISSFDIPSRDEQPSHTPCNQNTTFPTNISADRALLSAFPPHSISLSPFPHQPPLQQ